MSDYLSDLLTMFEACGQGAAPQINRTIINNYIVSTINSVDCGYETAILGKNKTSPVERYDDLEEAQKGHLKWVEFVKNTKEKPLKIKELGYLSLTDTSIVNIEPYDKEPCL